MSDVQAGGPADDPSSDAAADAAALGRRRLLTALRPRATRVQAAVGLLFVVLGFGVALQVRSTAETDGLTTARESDLVRILDDLTARNQRLAAEERDLQTTRDQLASGSGSSTTALDEARSRAASLGILAGTVAATGPGVVVAVTDPSGKVDASSLLDAVEELRDAGAEAMQLGSVRIVAETSFLDGRPGTVVVDGTSVAAPYTLTVIGDPRTMAAALRIPGGVVESLHSLGADTGISEHDRVDVTALRPVSAPQYARPSSTP